jgi:hypothetical protein
MLERLSPTTRTVLRVASGIAIAIAAGLGTLILFFVGAVTATGCFIECSDPNPVGGSLLLTGAVLGAAVTVTSGVWAVIGWNRRVLTRVAAAVAGPATLVVLVAVSGF